MTPQVHQQRLGYLQRNCYSSPKMTYSSKSQYLAKVTVIIAIKPLSFEDFYLNVPTCWVNEPRFLLLSAHSVYALREPLAGLEKHFRKKIADTQSWRWVRLCDKHESSAVLYLATGDWSVPWCRDRRRISWLWRPACRPCTRCPFRSLTSDGRSDSWPT